MSCSQKVSMTSRNALDKSIDLSTSVDVTDAPVSNARALFRQGGVGG